MILQSDAEEEGTWLGTGTQPTPKDHILTAPITQPISTAVGEEEEEEEEEEEITVLDEELDKFFLSPLASSASYPISKYLEAVHEHLSGTLPMDPAVSA